MTIEQILSAINRFAPYAKLGITGLFLQPITLSYAEPFLKIIDYSNIEITVDSIPTVVNA